MTIIGLALVAGMTAAGAVLRATLFSSLFSRPGLCRWCMLAITPVACPDCGMRRWELRALESSSPHPHQNCWHPQAVFTGGHAPL